MTGYPPLPGSPMLLDHLLGLLFLVHVLFMNYIVAAPLLTTWYLWVRFRTDGRQVAAWLAAPLPVMFTFAINFGVASLLFVQVLYADRFFTANIILGNIWLAVIILLMTAFYGAYFVHRTLSKKNSGGAVRAGAGGLIVTALVWAIGLIMMANYFLTTDQANWHGLLGHPQDVIHNSTFLPRLLHFLFGSMAVTGFWMVWIAWWKGQRHAPEADVLRFRRQGLLLAAGATGVQIIIGIWFLLWQPSEIWDALFSGSVPSMVWISGVATGLIMLGILIVSAVFPKRTLWPKVATALLFWTLNGMVAGRDVVRHAAFGKEYNLAQMPYHAQWRPMLIFFGLLLAGLGVIIWLIGLIWDKNPPSDASSKTEDKPA
jgi:hypothetical protein